MGIGIMFYYNFLIEGIYKDSLNICKLFLDLKMEMDILGKHPKIRN